MELRAGAALHAMVRPQGLRPVAPVDAVEGLSARVGRGKRPVAGRMPVLGQDHLGQSDDQQVDHRHDGIDVRERPRTAGQELHITVWYETASWGTKRDTN